METTSFSQEMAHKIYQNHQAINGILSITIGISVLVGFILIVLILNKSGFRFKSPRILQRMQVSMVGSNNQY